MILALCLDDKNGMAFNGRRQSMDRLLRAEEMLTAQERYEDAKRRLDALDREREQLQEMVNKYQATHKI